MIDTPRFIIFLALLVVIQAVLLDITKYYQIMFNLIKGKVKPTNVDIIFFILLFPFIVLMYIDCKVIGEKKFKFPCGDNICKWWNRIKK